MNIKSIAPNKIQIGLIFFAVMSMSFLLKPDYANSTIDFKIKNAGISVTGSFKKFETSIEFNESAKAPSSIKATIQVGTIDTGIEGRDKHLKKEEYFNVETYPTITFVSTKVLKTTTGSFIVEGNLTIKGVRKEIKIPFTYIDNTFQGTLSLNRRDYNVGGSSITMSDDVAIMLKVVILK
ncbi:YceI family protein [uncultured Cytophaga sp.]|uniref:YceI family protein n=1 Tax=uncultured Cytophaga sp. TaxID=160238 RepID=UPI002635A708|nr:YceI family protein [uncultured Cytophaga sp.]